MTISEVSKQTNISTYTLRYYEDIGLITDIKRNENNLRVYEQDDLNKIEFISCLRNANVSLNALKEYMYLLNQNYDTNAERLDILVKERENLLKKQEELNIGLELLNYKIDNYEKIMKK